MREGLPSGTTPTTPEQQHEESGHAPCEWLKPFCSTDQFRKHLLKPWSSEGFTYATDGRILVRVPFLVCPADPNPDAPNKQVAAIGKWDHAELSEWMPIPNDLPPVNVRDCYGCKGTGKRGSCRNCNGTGECECECGDEHSCGSCHGSGIDRFNTGGEQTTCGNCGGSGKLTSPTGANIGKGFLNVEYLKKIAALPNALINPPLVDETMVAFKFDGGTGYLMPMRRGQGSEVRA